MKENEKRIKSKYQKHKKKHYTPVILIKINEKKNIGIIKIIFKKY